jgi:putative (di)nucleoside polyphosphate hydrolase
LLFHCCWFKFLKQLIVCDELGKKVIDEDGYRLNVGIIVFNDAGQLLWAKRRFGQDAWQFPQGGIREGETAVAAMYRELEEELGLKPEAVAIVAESKEWHCYDLPLRFLRKNTPRLCIGQRQRWFLLKMNVGDEQVELCQSPRPEFKDWCWVAYWHPVEGVIDFKKQVYQDVLTEFESYMS